ncbi:protein-disulfide isomerase-like protein with CxxC motif [Virgibacillus natechei]|uniref:Protein-disulfide isomerase-like protein with CxxC motif n=1 Tax=Virgibacillus natechei TaxID=1216297 RepID=A0ABS4IEX4_9BACI|nr:thioredoxin family protein [Virgibacillus natechei]MBP1969502.1 protein-disulfide isomerase-like protein with CxxC motif [Virgibacillus natechei]UZD11794.1 thioredoxin family protein [Virgibacillus natechei]
MQEITNEVLEQDSYILYIYTPFCGTCHVARTMLTKIESVHKETIFYQMNASLYAEFMQEHKIESVPCLLIKEGNEVKEKIYAFRSIANIYSYLTEYKPDLFVKS